VTILLSVGLLKERLNAIQVAGVVASLAAIYAFNVGGESGLFSSWIAFVLIPIGLWGMGAFLQKVSTGLASSELSTLAFLAAFIPVALAAPAIETIRWKLDARTWIFVALLGLLFGLGNLTLIFAYGSGGKGSVVTPLASLYSLVTIPLAVMLLKERISMREGIGIALALGAVVALCRETPDSEASQPATRAKSSASG
jgi:transporter family protein